MRFPYLAILLCLPTATATATAQGLADLHYAPTLANVNVGDTFDVSLRMSSQGAPLADVGALDVIISYDPAVLTLLGSSQLGAGYTWFAQGFLPDVDMINTDITDGEAIFTALAQITTPAIPPVSPGLIVTTLQFQANAMSAGSVISIAPSAGAFGVTKVLDFSSAGLVVTGDISSQVNVVIADPSLEFPFCSGDGTGTPCPCGANAGLGQGCLNSGGIGAQLVASGTASISNDSFQLAISGVPGNKPGLILRGSNQLNGGAGNPAGDGLLCTSMMTARSHVQITSAGSTLFTHFSGGPFGASSYGPGVMANYQFWYRDPMGTCSGAGFNFTNAWAVTWQP